MSETIDDIVCEMREWWMRNDNEEAAAELTSFANRIETACEALIADRDNWRRQALDEDARANATRDKSSQVGNAAAMYEALKAVVKVGYPHNFQHEAPHIRGYCYEITTAINKCFAALAAPPRNCDVMDWRTAWVKWRTELHTQKPCGYAEVVSGTEQFMDWYMSEAKGERK
jgi:hypothetical protein